jgi:hypothetical protein
MHGREAEAERHVSLKPEERNERAGLGVELTELAHRSPQSLGVI